MPPAFFVRVRFGAPAEKTRRRSRASARVGRRGGRDVPALSFLMKSPHGRFHIRAGINSGAKTGPGRSARRRIGEKERQAGKTGGKIRARSGRKDGGEEQARREKQTRHGKQTRRGNPALEGARDGKA